MPIKYVKIGEHYPPHRTGGMNSVLKGGNTEKAIDLLKRTVTDEEISNLLKYGTEEIFGRTGVESTTGLRSTRASELLKLLVERGLVENVKGQGKGKYRFRE